MSGGDNSPRKTAFPGNSRASVNNVPGVESQPAGNRARENLSRGLVRGMMVVMVMMMLRGECRAGKHHQEQSSG